MALRLLDLCSSPPILLLPILLLFAVNQPRAQSTQRGNGSRTASISGRVAIGGAPAPNALVMVIEVDPKTREIWFGNMLQQGAFIKVRTDNDGRYRVTGLAPGAYLINALSQAYVRSKNSTDFDTYKSVTLDDGESREGVDITLVRGGVITGRVVDAEGRPLIASSVSLQTVDEDGQTIRGFEPDDWMMMRTDDRGVYRIYGLPAGRYIVGAGGDGAASRAKRKYPETFYPDATDWNGAKIIEVKEGAEVAGIDIRLGAGKNTYEASGRVIDAETGQPLTQVWVTCVDAPDDEYGGGDYGRRSATDDEGRFSFTGLSTGQYELYLSNQRATYRSRSASMGNNEHYSERTRFAIGDSDVSGLEIKANRGSTISGIVYIEGVNDPAIKARLQQAAVGIRIGGQLGSDGNRMGREDRGQTGARIAGDGSFHLAGLAPGLASFELQSDQANIFSIKRIERDGAEIRSAFEIGRGERITGVRIGVAHNNGTIRGKVEISGGKLPEGWQLSVSAYPVDATAGGGVSPAFHSGGGSVFADEKGRFAIENLAAGEYDLTLSPMERVELNQWKGVSEVTQRVTVNSGAETQVKLTLDMAGKQQEKRR
jgi:protocatechuate 3,4-dioxygenase beta subunit